MKLLWWKPNWILIFALNVQNVKALYNPVLLCYNFRTIQLFLHFLNISFHQPLNGVVSIGNLIGILYNSWTLKIDSLLNLVPIALTHIKYSYQQLCYFNLRPDYLMRIYLISVQFLCLQYLLTSFFVQVFYLIVNWF